MEGLGGENSSRLVLGGLLADFGAEHYTWVATGDKENPDTTTVQARAGTRWNGNSEEQKLNQHGSESDGSE